LYLPSSERHVVGISADCCFVEVTKAKETSSDTCVVIFVSEQDAGHVGIKIYPFEGIVVALHTDFCIHDLREVQVKIQILGFHVDGVSAECAAFATTDCIGAVTPVVVIELKFRYQFYIVTCLGCVAETNALDKIVLCFCVLCKAFGV